MKESFLVNDIPSKELEAMGLSIKQLDEMGYLQTLLGGGMTPYLKLREKMNGGIKYCIMRLYLWHSINGSVILRKEKHPEHERYTEFFSNSELMRLAQLNPICKIVMEGGQIVQYLVQLNYENGGYHFRRSETIPLPAEIGHWIITSDIKRRLYQGESVILRKGSLQLTIHLDLNRPEGFYYYIDKVVSKKKRKNGGGN
jgi:hypothetical protein